MEEITPWPTQGLEDVAVLRFTAVSLAVVDVVVEETSATMVVSTMVLTIVLNVSFVGRWATLSRGDSSALIEHSLAKRKVHHQLLHHMTSTPIGMLTQGLRNTLLVNLTS
jgi:hypothetical protein